MVKALTIGIIAGEESGDLLAADLVNALVRLSKSEILLVGVGGAHLRRLGLNSFFDADDLALMGVGEVFVKIPRLWRHLNKVTEYLAQSDLDCLIVIDSPEFTHRVAKRLKKIKPNLPIVQYVAPSVWAWRPERARLMRDFIDQLLVILPFEAKLLQELGGPKAIYVGHRLTNDPDVLRIKQERQQTDHNAAPCLMVLPGSRKSEITRLMPVFGKAVKIIVKKIPNLSIVLPTLPNLKHQIDDLAKHWRVVPRIVVGSEQKWQAFAAADVALAASGTVSLELALCAIPTVLSYKTDVLTKLFIQPRITTWSAALPNVIADEPIVPEYFNEFVRPGMLARQIIYILRQGPARQAQLEGFKRVDERMKISEPSGVTAAKAVLELIDQKSGLAKS